MSDSTAYELCENVASVLLLTLPLATTTSLHLSDEDLTAASLCAASLKLLRCCYSALCPYAFLQHYFALLRLWHC